MPAGGDRGAGEVRFTVSSRSSSSRFFFGQRLVVIEELRADDGPAVSCLAGPLMML